MPTVPEDPLHGMGAYGWVPIVADASIEFNMGVIFLLPVYEIWNFSSSAWQTFKKEKVCVIESWGVSSWWEYFQRAI